MKILNFIEEKAVEITAILSVIAIVAGIILGIAY